MSREINLTGGEITLLKQIGLSGGQMFGKILVGKVEEEQSAEFLDTLLGLIDLGYVLSNRVNLRTLEEVEKAFFRVNAAHLVELRDAVNPSRRRERERSQQRRRRRR